MFTALPLESIFELTMFARFLLPVRRKYDLFIPVVMRAESDSGRDVSHVSPGQLRHTPADPHRPSRFRDEDEPLRYPCRRGLLGEHKQRNDPC
jgi:hypothetical protein